MPKVSVIVPAFNSGQYIREALLSILAQDYQDLEIVVVDDASTDNTREVVNALNSDKIHYIRLPENHGGPSKPRNVGIKNARGEYIAIFDSDDLMLPGRLSAAVSVLDRHSSIALIFTNMVKINKNTGDSPTAFLDSYDRFNRLKTNQSSSNLFIIDPPQAFNCLFYENYISTSSVTVRKSVFDAVGYFDEELTNADDLDMWFRISHKYILAFVDSITVKYRVREGSISGRGAKLANNRIKVYLKRMDLDLNWEERHQAHKQIAVNYSGMGYSYRCANQMKEARKYYLLSLNEEFNWRVVIQILITYLGNDIIGFIRKTKNKFMFKRYVGSARDIETM